MGPGDHVVGRELEVGTGEKGAHGRADQQDAHRTVDEQEQLVYPRTEQVHGFFPVLVADRLDNESEQDQDPDPVGPAERCRVELGKRGEQGPAEQDQGGKGQLPFPAQRIDHQALFGFGFRHLPEQGLSSLDKGQEEEQGPDNRAEQPPQMLQGRVIKIANHVSSPPVQG